ncbi:hypothetical protein Barb6_01509 [Bacteroidales bacterium Barb6]|nr:hypothetical protein Barb6_01509 [Bacteroidales bacterium Barb6]
MTELCNIRKGRLVCLPFMFCPVTALTINI